MQYLGSLMAIIFSIAQAITVRMGHLLGSGDRVGAEYASYAGITLAAFLMILTALVFWFFPGVLIAIDFDIHNPKNIDLVRLITQLLLVSAIFQFFEAIRIALFGSLRGLKDTHFTLTVSILSFWGIALPIGYALAISLHLGGTGYWWGMVIGSACSVLLLFWRFKIMLRRV